MNKMKENHAFNMPITEKQCTLFFFSGSSTAADLFRTKKTFPRNARTQNESTNMV